MALSSLAAKYLKQYIYVYDNMAQSFPSARPSHLPLFSVQDNTATPSRQELSEAIPLSNTELPLSGLNTTPLTSLGRSTWTWAASSPGCWRPAWRGPSKPAAPARQLDTPGHCEGSPSE